MDDADRRAVPQSTAAAPLALTRIALTNFRSYTRTELALEAAPVVLAGANGSGKTNCLEAVSLLSPGRGLRGAKLSQLQRNAPVEASQDGDAFAQSLWAVAATLARPDGAFDIGTGLLPTAMSATARRTLHLNGAPAQAADLAGLIPMLWLTPAQDRIFVDSAGDRRRFLDRLVFGLDPAHAKRAARYERAMQERMRVLREGGDAAWLDSLEDTMAEIGAALSAARLSVIATLNDELAARGAAGAFPCAHLRLVDGLEARAADRDALRAGLTQCRARDAESGRTGVGPSTADLDVRHTAKRADARDCSTGEQKALLISIVLANAWAQAKKNDGNAPVLLLDEIAAHLDSQRRAALFEEVLALKTQAWMTGTDRSLFAPIASRAQCFSIASGQFVGSA